MSRTYCGTAPGGTTPEASTASGSIWVAASRFTMSLELIVSAGLFAALKFPIFTVRGDGTRVYSAACATGDAAIASPQHAIAKIFNLITTRLMQRFEAGGANDLCAFRADDGLQQRFRVLRIGTVRTHRAGKTGRV